MSPVFYSLFLLGNMFVIRTLQVFRARALLTTSGVTKIGTLHVAGASFLIFFARENAEFGIFCELLLLSSTGIILFLCERSRISKFRNEIPLFFDRWIMNLRLGFALTNARNRALLEHSEGFQILVRPIFSVNASDLRERGRAHPLFAAKILSELEKIASEPHAGLARLENLRRHLKKSSEFRRKSGQAMRQTAIQMAVMLVLLFALTLFSLNRYGWRRCGDLILYAQILSVLGLLCMWLVARKAKWKI